MQQDEKVGLGQSQNQQGIRIIKPAVVAHCNPDKDKARNAIYSCDIQKGGERIATGGGDSSVKIWKMSGLLGTPDECDAALLASLCNHTKSVNVVRWSKDGQFLASGSDDCYILVYKLDSSGYGMSSQPFGSSNAIQNKECWSRCLTLHGHSMDVLDLDWSPKGYIASASIDNKIMIWDLTSHVANPHSSNLAMVASPYRVLDSHQSFVKGVSFDPVGSYLASSSADNVLLVWSMDTWTVDTTLTEPMANSVDRTIFRRMSWAPDGGSLCVSSATKAAKPVGMVLKRDTWQSQADLVGHDAQSTCCRFAPHIKVAEKRKKRSSPSGVEGTPVNDSKKQFPCNIVALGDHEGVVSVWSTLQHTPLLVLNEIFGGPVLDITWTVLPGSLANNSAIKSGVSTDGLTTDLLATSSLDGTLVLVMFDSGSLSGKHERMMTVDEREGHFRKMYGRAQSEILETPEPLLEGPSVLKYRSGPKDVTNGIANGTKPVEIINGTGNNVVPRPIQSSTQVNMSAMQQRPPQVLQQQKVTVSKSGKKRIQPMLLNNSGAPAGDSGTNGSSLLMSSSPTTKSLSSAPNFASSRNLMNQIQKDVAGGTTSSGFAPSQLNNNPNGTLPKRAKLSDGGPLSGDSGATLSTGNIISLQFPQNTVVCRSTQLKEKDGDDIVTCIYGEVKKASTTVPTMRGGLSSMMSKPDSHNDKSVVSLKAKYVSCPAQFGRSRNFNTTLSHITAHSMATAVKSMECDKSTSVSASTVVWDAFVNGEVTAMCALPIAALGSHPVVSLSSAGDGVCVVGTNDGAIHLLSLESGMRLSPVFILGAPVISIDIIKVTSIVSRILLVAADGDVFLYDLAQTVPDKSSTQLSFVLKTSLRSLLVSMRCGALSSTVSGAVEEQELEVQRAYLSGKGDAVVSVSSKKQLLGGNWQTFQFCPNAQLWMRVADMRNLLSGVFMGVSTLTQNGHVSTSDPALECLDKEVLMENSLSMADVLAVSRASHNASSKDGMACFTSQLTLSHIEERIATAFALGSIDEARLWLSEWTTFCCRHHLLKKIRWVVNRLVMACKQDHQRCCDDQVSTSTLNSWAWLDTSFKQVLGVSKLDILRDNILPAISRSDTSQSLLIEITDVLDSGTN